MKELPAGLNRVLRNRTVHSTILSVEIQGTSVENFMSSTEGYVYNAHLGEAGCFQLRKGK
jgi:hypothetical protein